MSWRVARSLDVLLDEINAAAPRRSKISDGSIGDAAHASRSSDHNPWIVDHNGIGVVRARDFTHDPGGGLDCNELAHALAQIVSVGSHPAARSGAYIIWRRQILSFDRRSEGWRPYSGSNPHDKHLHLSVATAASGYDSTQRWGLDAPEEDDMADYANQLKRIENKVDKLRNGTYRRHQFQVKVMRGMLDGLDELARSTSDDATKKQARDLWRVLNGHVEADKKAEQTDGEGDASPRP